MKNILLGLMLLTTGCTFNPTQSDIDRNVTNLKLPANYKQLAMDELNQTLFDPMSAKIEFLNNEFHCASYRGIQNGGFEWKVCTTIIINAKNRYGAYVGNTTYEFCTDGYTSNVSDYKCQNNNFQQRYR
jgi:hypothetical protein